jgi:hypothetical protein
VGQGAEEVKPSQQPTKTNVKIALFNGTTTSGLTNRFASDISKKITDVNFSVIAKENANSQNYEKTQIIDLSGKNQDVVRSLALAFKAVSGKLPDGETAPEGAEVLVIIGADYASASVKPVSTVIVPPTTAPTTSE